LQRQVKVLWLHPPEPVIIGVEGLACLRGGLADVRRQRHGDEDSVASFGI
jgi:hypothetical protein